MCSWPNDWSGIINGHLHESHPERELSRNANVSFCFIVAIPQVQLTALILINSISTSGHHLLGLIGFNPITFWNKGCHLIIASYNLHFGGHTNDANHWQKLNAEFQPDFICAQESWHPSKYFSPEEFSQFKGCIHSNVHHGKWGSAILSRNHELEEISLNLSEFEGWVVGARIPDLVIGGVAQPILIFSVHAPSPGPYEPRVDRLLNALTQKWGKTPMIIAGDFNITTAIRKETEQLKNTPGEVRILNRLQSETGVINAWQHLHQNDELPQTLRWSNKPLEHYHCDGIFVSEIHIPHLHSARIISAGVWATMSDHNPLIVSLT